MNTPPWEKLLAGDLGELRENHLYRERRVIRCIDPAHVEWCGKRYTNFASNNYLGLTHHPRLIEAGRDALTRFGAGSGAASLISGYGPAHASAEQAIASWKGSEGAVLLPSGYQANQAAIQTIAAVGARNPGAVRFLIDKLAHASLIDAVRGSGAAFRIFPHNHLKKLERLLSEAEEGQLQVVVTESIFSMNGDAAPLLEISLLRKRYAFLLLLDEAHATGVYGPAGEGLAVEMGVKESVDVSVVTFSKALGSVGGAICASSAFCDAVVNRGRAFIYTTCVPPHLAAIAEAAVKVVQEEPQRRRRVRELARRLRDALVQSGWRVASGDSPIIPIVSGTAESALSAANVLLGQGMLVGAVRPPTVARGQSRLRITVCSEHTQQEIDSLAEALLLLAPPV